MKQEINYNRRLEELKHAIRIVCKLKSKTCEEKINDIYNLVTK